VNKVAGVNVCPENPYLKEGLSIVDPLALTSLDELLLIMQIIYTFLQTNPVVAWIADMNCNFYLMKNDIIANNSATSENKEEISTCLESLDFQRFYHVYFIIF
jgi:sulfur transfer complex TusBCD TusB component (DsrH family)